MVKYTPNEDAKEDIELCLSCPYPDCIDCLQSGSMKEERRLYGSQPGSRTFCVRQTEDIRPWLKTISVMREGR